MEKKEREKIKNMAFRLAQSAFRADEVPVGAVIFNSETGEIIAKAHNQTEQKKDVLDVFAFQKLKEIKKEENHLEETKEEVLKEEKKVDEQPKEKKLTMSDFFDEFKL